MRLAVVAVLTLAACGPTAQQRDIAAVQDRFERRVSAARASEPDKVALCRAQIAPRPDLTADMREQAIQACARQAMIADLREIEAGAQRELDAIERAYQNPQRVRLVP
jgi:hypothetical protein